jgi:hypothetical protein
MPELLDAVVLTPRHCYRYKNYVCALVTIIYLYCRKLLNICILETNKFLSGFESVGVNLLDMQCLPFALRNKSRLENCYSFIQSEIVIIV